MTEVDRRAMLGIVALGGASVAAGAAVAAPKELSFADLKKEAEMACLYHCDFADAKRFDAMLRNINNHLSVYKFDPFAMKIVMVMHGPGVKFFLKDLSGTPWANDPVDPELQSRAKGLAQYGVDAYLCKITFERLKIDPAKALDEAYIKFVPSGVATVAALQGKGFSYIKCG